MMGIISIYVLILYITWEIIFLENYPKNISEFESVWMFLDLEKVTFCAILNELQLYIMSERGPKIWAVVIILSLFLEQQCWFLQNFQDLFYSWKYFKS